MENKRILYTRPEDGGLSIIVPAPGMTLEDCLKAVPEGLPHEVVDVEAVPADRTFRNAWLRDTTPSPQKVGVDLPKAKDITHARRRAAREKEFAPLDERIAKKLPGNNLDQAEAAREAIRVKYADQQARIDACSCPEELKSIIVGEGL